MADEKKTPPENLEALLGGLTSPSGKSRLLRYYYSFDEAPLGYEQLWGLSSQFRQGLLEEFKETNLSCSRRKKQLDVAPWVLSAISASLGDVEKAVEYGFRCSGIGGFTISHRAQTMQYLRDLEEHDLIIEHSDEPKEILQACIAKGGGVATVREAYRKFCSAGRERDIYNYEEKRKEFESFLPKPKPRPRIKTDVERFNEFLDLVGSDLDKFEELYLTALSENKREPRAGFRGAFVDAAVKYSQSDEFTPERRDLFFQKIEGRISPLKPGFVAQIAATLDVDREKILDWCEKGHPHYCDVNLLDLAIHNGVWDYPEKHAWAVNLARYAPKVYSLCKQFGLRERLREHKEDLLEGLELCMDYASAADLCTMLEDFTLAENYQALAKL